MEFDYFYNRDGDRYSFYMLPKILVSGDIFKSLSSDSKILYSCLLERTSLSAKNNWLDDEKRVYIIFTIDQVMEVLNKSNKTSVKVLDELEKIGLIERKRQGLGKPNLIYVKDFMTAVNAECKNYTSEVKNLHFRSEGSTLQEVKKLQGSNTNYIKTDISNKNKREKTQCFGRFQNVYLTDKEIQILREEIPYQLDNYIERLSAYMKSTGRNYKNHKATILSWFYQDQGNKKEKSPVIKTDYEKGVHL